MGYLKDLSINLKRFLVGKRIKKTRLQKDLIVTLFFTDGSQLELSLFDFPVMKRKRAEAAGEIARDTRQMDI